MLRMPPQGFDARLFYGLGTILRRIYYTQNFVWRDQAYLALGDGVHVERVPGLEMESWAPPLEVAVWDHTILLVCGGTNRLEQWLSHVIMSGLYQHQEWPGKVHGYFAPAAWAAWEAMRPAVIREVERNPNRKILVIGHSYGGSLAQLMGYKVWQEYGPLFEGVISFSAPRTGDREWAAEVGSKIRITRLQASGDVFPDLPPKATFVFPLGFTPTTINYEPYEHAGRGITLGADGQLSFDADEEGIIFPAVRAVDPVWTPVRNTHGFAEINLRLRLRIQGGDPSSREFPTLSLADHVNETINAAEGRVWRFTR